MSRLTRVQQEARARIEQAATAGLSPEQLGARLLAAVNHALPNDGMRLFGVDPGPNLINRVLAASQNDAEARAEWLREVYLQTPRNNFIDLRGLPATAPLVMAYQDRLEECWGAPRSYLDTFTEREHVRYFHESGTPVGGVIFANFRARGRWVACLHLYRRETGHPFLPNEIAFLRLMAPTIGAAIGAALAREALRRVPDQPQAPGILVLDALGRVALSTPAAERWSDVLREPGSGDAVPAAARSAVAALLGGELPVVTLVVPSREGPISVEASPADDARSVAVILRLISEPAHAGAPSDWCLTPTERSVVDLVLAGLTNRDIAARMSLSERTVESHLGHVYAKLEVPNRSALLASFFHQRYLPGILSQP